MKKRRQHPVLQPIALMLPLNVTRNDVCDSALVNIHVAYTRDSEIFFKLLVLHDI